MPTMLEARWRPVAAGVGGTIREVRLIGRAGAGGLAAEAGEVLSRGGRCYRVVEASGGEDGLGRRYVHLRPVRDGVVDTSVAF
jgi:hypothetical protein